MIRIDTDAVSRFAKIEPGTLNVWIQRHLLPGVSVRSSGQRRSFTLDDAMHIAIMAHLVRLGLASPIASAAAAKAREEWRKPNAILSIAPTEEQGLSRV